MSEEKKPFTVTDRRHFTPEGEARSSSSPEPAAAPTDRAAAASPEDEPSAAGEGRSADFTTLLLSLGAQAGMLLQDQGELKADLIGARAIISMLEVLSDKTEGRRTADEDRVLESLLYELRMAYVERSKSPRGA
jgi:hypothetical protein